MGLRTLDFSISMAYVFLSLNCLCGQINSSIYSDAPKSNSYPYSIFICLISFVLCLKAGKPPV